MAGNKPPRVLVLGGGYVAKGFVRSAAPAIRRGLVDVTVIDQDNYQFFHGLVAELIVGRIGGMNALSPARRIFRPAHVHIAHIESIDLEGRVVHMSRSIDGAVYSLDYDHLVLGVGSVDNVELYPGLGEHAFKLKSFDDCFRLRNHIITMFELADIERDPEERRRLLTFFVAGGGYAGTEVAAEIADLTRELCGKEYPGVGTHECRVVIVQPGPHILPELYGAGGKHFRKLVEYATRHVTKIGVEMMTDTFVTAASPNEVSLSNGRRVPTRTIISAVGTKPSPLLSGLDLPRDVRGRVKTDRFVRVEGFENVWGGGDCAAVPERRGGYSPPRATFARQHGMTAGHNIVASVTGRPLKEYSYRSVGQGVPLGRRRAVGDLYGVPIKGAVTWFILRGFLLYFIPSWDRRLRVLADWLLAPIVGRDIVEADIADADDYELSHELFQPGEVIVSEGRPGRYVHVIVEGEVDLVTTTNGEEQVIATLKAGDNFGHVWRDEAASESAKAKTVVKTVSMRTDQTRRIQQLLASLGKVAAN